MKTQGEIEARIREIESAYAHVLRGSFATVMINSPRALMQLEAETKLSALHWVLGTSYKSRLTIESETKKPFRKPMETTPDR